MRRITERDCEECDKIHKRVVGTSRLVSLREDAAGPHPILVAHTESGEIVGYDNKRSKKKRRSERGKEEEGGSKERSEGEKDTHVFNEGTERE